MKQTCVIIGAGLGGLFTGALLAKNGIDVTVLEKNAVIGGGLQCFCRNGMLYETGMHILGGFRPGGNLDRICRYLGIRDRLEIEHLDPDWSDTLYIPALDREYRIATGRDNFVRRMSELFPDEAAGIRGYVDEIYDIASSLPLFSLRPGPSDIARQDMRYTMPADRLIASHVRNPLLRDLLAYLNPIYGGRAGHSPAYVHALINVLFINGPSRFKGGSQQLADALADTIRDCGGRVIPNDPAVNVVVKDKRVESVTSRSGMTLSPDWTISAIHPSALVRIMSPGAFTPALTRRIDSIPNSPSAFSLYLELKPESVPYIPRTGYYVRNVGFMWDQAEVPGNLWPAGFLFMTPPEREQSEWARRMLVHCPMNFESVRRWEKSVSGKRGRQYEEWKEKMAGKVMDRLEEILPGIRKAVARMWTSSPLTVRDYYNVKEGAIFGYTHDSENILLSQMPIKTRVENLLLTGQNVMLHGICGVPLTAIRTSETILGPDHIINGIINSEKCKIR